MVHELDGFDKAIWLRLRDLIMKYSDLHTHRTNQLDSMDFIVDDRDPLRSYIGYDMQLSRLLVCNPAWQYFIFGGEVPLIDWVTEPEEKEFVKKVMDYMIGYGVEFDEDKKA